MRVIITGGTGLIGRALAADLTKDGHETIVLSRQPEQAAGLPAGARVERWDAQTAEGWGSLADSAEAQAAFAVRYGKLFSFITWTSGGLMSAAAAVGGQNLGAARPDRTIRAVHSAAAMALGVAGVVGSLFLLIPDLLLGVFGMTDPVTLRIGVQLLRYLAVSGVFVCLALTYTGGLQGTGDTKGPLYISIISQVILPLGYCWVVQETRGLSAADIWLAIVLGHIARAALSALRFRQGNWRHIEVRVN